MTDTPYSQPIAVVGAGVMGRGIAYAAIASGIPTSLVDTDPEQLRAAQQRIKLDLQGGVERGRLTEEAAARAERLLTLHESIAEAASDVSLAIEAVVERMETKHEVFRTLEAAAPTTAVIATNTSAMSITEIAAALQDPARGIGMHFFNPVPKMKLCELVIGLETAESTTCTAELVARTMGKSTVRIADLPGFATSRVNALIGNEGLRMLEEGVGSPEDLDTAIRLGLNHPMGPLEMADLVGLDVRLAVLEHLERTLGERFRPTNLHRRLVAAGRLGRKSGHGIYRYDENGARLDEPSALGR